MSDMVSVVYVGPFENEAHEDPEIDGSAVAVQWPPGSEQVIYASKGVPLDIPAELANGFTVPGNEELGIPDSHHGGLLDAHRLGEANPQWVPAPAQPAERGKKEEMTDAG